MSGTPRFDVVVVGASLGGLTSAGPLASRSARLEGGRETVGVLTGRDDVTGETARERALRSV